MYFRKEAMMAHTMYGSAQHIADWDISNRSLIRHVVQALKCCIALKKMELTRWSTRTDLYSIWATAAHPPFIQQHFFCFKWMTVLICLDLWISLIMIFPIFNIIHYYNIIYIYTILINGINNKWLGFTKVSLHLYVKSIIKTSQCNTCIKMHELISTLVSVKFTKTQKLSQDINTFRTNRIFMENKCLV